MQKWTLVFRFIWLFVSMNFWISDFSGFLSIDKLLRWFAFRWNCGLRNIVVHWYIGTLVHCNVFELPIVAISFHLQVLLRWRPCFPVWKHPTWLTTTDQSVINFCATLLDIKSMEAIKSLPIRSVPSIDKPSVFAHLHSKLLSCFPPLATITEWTEIFMTGGIFPGLWRTCLKGAVGAVGEGQSLLLLKLCRTVQALVL